MPRDGILGPVLSTSNTADLSSRNRTIITGFFADDAENWHFVKIFTKTLEQNSGLNTEMSNREHRGQPQ